MTLKARRPLRTTIMLGVMMLAIVASLGLSDTTRASSISSADKDAYMNLAQRVPKDASVVALFANLDRSVGVVDTLLQRYAQTDPTFQYNQLVLSLKGPLGFNPLSAQELAGAGLDMSAGIAAFAFRQDGTPLLTMRAVDPAKARASLDHVALQINQSRPFEAPVGADGVRSVFYTQTGTPAGDVTLAVAFKDKVLLLMFAPESKEWFDRHVKAALELSPPQSLATDAAFTRLLGRLEPDTAFVSYNNYAQYLKDLRSGAKKLSDQLGQGGGLGDVSPLLFMEQALSLAESFTAQIFAVSLNAQGAGFVHEIMGPPDKVKTFRELFAVASPRAFDKLPLAADPIGSLYATLNFRKVYERLIGGKSETKEAYTKWNTLVKTESAVDLEKDIYDNLTGELAVLFYGIAPIPADLAKAPRVSQAEVANLANLVFVVGLKNPAGTVELLKAARGKLDQAGKPAKSLDRQGFSVLQHMHADGLDLYMGVRGNLFVFGIGKGSLDAAFGKPGTLNLVEGPDVVAHLKMDFGRLVTTMENLKPPAGATNTQLFQQYQMWSTQIAGKLKFVKRAEAKSVQGAEGFRTSGRLTL